MFGMGIGEILVILVVALLLIGPKKLPEVARSLGKALGEFKKAAEDIRHGFQEETGYSDLVKKSSPSSLPEPPEPESCPYSLEADSPDEKKESDSAE